MTQSFRPSITQKCYFHWYCPNSSYVSFCQELNHSALIVLSNELELFQVLSDITDRKYFTHWNWKQDCSLSRTNSNWYIRTYSEIIIYLMYHKSDYRHTRKDRWIHTELAFTLAKNATKPNPFDIIPLQTTRKDDNWKTEEALARAAVTLETKWIKESNPWCLWWWCIISLFVKVY